MKPSNKLARVFASVAGAEQQMESTAAGILSIVRDAKIHDVKAWDAAVREAYKSNGWNARAGRPATGNDAVPVPSTVRTYVTIVRRAIKAKMKLAKYTTFTALRVALAKKNGATSHRGEGDNGKVPEEVAENFTGVRVIGSTDPNGALFHDLAAVFIHLPDEHRDVFGRQLSRLLHKYLPLAKGIKARLPAPDSVKKAA